MDMDSDEDDDTPKEEEEEARPEPEPEPVRTPPTDIPTAALKSLSMSRFGLSSRALRRFVQMRRRRKRWTRSKRHDYIRYMGVRERERKRAWLPARAFVAAPGRTAGGVT